MPETITFLADRGAASWSTASAPFSRSVLHAM